MNYQDKENYVTVEPSVEFWASHVNSLVIEDYKDHLVGHAADLGCNHGACTIVLARRGGITKVIGIDVCQAAIIAAEKLLTECGEPRDVRAKVSYACADLQRIPLGDATLDCATSFHTLEHIYPSDHDNIIGEVRRVLRVGAALVIAVPFGHSSDDPHHVAWFDEESLSAVFETRGFDVLECRQDLRGKSGPYLNLLCRKS